MLRKRAKKAGVQTAICCHSNRGTGITNYLLNGGELEVAQLMAGHESPRTTKLYDRREEKVMIEEVQKVRFRGVA